MHPFWGRAATAVVASVLVTACQPEAPAEPQLVTPSEAKARMAKGEAVTIVDVRSPMGYHNEHIEGALNVPLSNIAQNQHGLPKDRWVLLYCT